MANQSGQNKTVSEMSHRICTNIQITVGTQLGYETQANDHKAEFVVQGRCNEIEIM